MRRSNIKAKLSRQEVALCTLLHFTDPSVFELASLMGFDGIWMDMEHHGYSVETASNLMRAARVGTADIMVRPGKGEFMRMGRLLEMGAQGVMYPRCNSAAEAREVVRWSKFAPIGERGFDGGNPDMPYCTMNIADYVREANEQVFVIVQLEDPKSIESADEIAAIEGIDALFFGPADFTVLSGIPGEFNHPSVQRAMEKISASCRRAGKAWGSTCSSLEHAKRLISLGATFLCHGADLVMVKNGLEEIQKQFATIGMQFQNQLNGSGKHYMESAGVTHRAIKPKSVVEPETV
jgi:4-hydroxy-2-oxoheptanedioate aldolase